jgi:hypothetical protein
VRVQQEQYRKVAVVVAVAGVTEVVEEVVGLGVVAQEVARVTMVAVPEVAVGFILSGINCFYLLLVVHIFISNS